VWICTPDKDLAQCVKDGRVVQLERRTNKVIDEAGVIAKFGVEPRSIPDWLALVGDSADGFPGLSGWGPASAAAVLRRYGHLDAIPRDAPWDVALRGADRLQATLGERFADALLFKRLATLRTDIDVFATVDDLRWRGPRAEFAAFCARLEAPRLLDRARTLAEKATAS
jgi:5'-3' exonuclease